MDCPNCGVYNAPDRQVCWRCDKELPKPKQDKKRKADPRQMMRRTWIIVGIAIVLWIILSWVLPMFLGGPATPTP
jgi:hypothetical protein